MLSWFSGWESDLGSQYVLVLLVIRIAPSLCFSHINQFQSFQCVPPGFGLGSGTLTHSLLPQKERMGTSSLERLSPKKSFHQSVLSNFFFPIPVYVSDLAEGYRSHGTDSICKFCIWCMYWQRIFIPFVNSAHGMRVCVGGGGGSYLCLSENYWGRKYSILTGRRREVRKEREGGRK